MEKEKPTKIAWDFPVEMVRDLPTKSTRVIRDE